MQSDEELDDVDAELAAAIAASLQKDTPQEVPQGPTLPELATEPAEGTDGTLELAFRLPDGGRTQRRFLATAATEQLYAFLAGPPASLPPARCRVVRQFPRQQVDCSPTQTLADAQLTHRDVLCVERLAS
jgi:hypothetical protein